MDTYTALCVLPLNAVVKCTDAIAILLQVSNLNSAHTVLKRVNGCKIAMLRTPNNCKWADCRTQTSVECGAVGHLHAQNTPQAAGASTSDLDTARACCLSSFNLALCEANSAFLAYTNTGC